MPWLIHTSALTHLPTSEDAHVWATRIERGDVRVCTTTLLEAGSLAGDMAVGGTAAGGTTAGNAASGAGARLRAALDRPPLAVMPLERLTPAAEDRAVQVLALLADHGAELSERRELDDLSDLSDLSDLGVLDVLTAANAEVCGLTLLHLAPRFELIAEVTGQPVERLRVA